MTGELSPDQRARDLAAAGTEKFDVVVVGGGITGAGVALDAVTRGLSVLLLEADDFAAGTSSKSSKLIHGGLRYLEMLDFTLVREALRERKLHLTELAPHLVKPVSFVWPLTHRGWERWYLGAGLTLYDTMGGAGAVPAHRHLSKTTMRRVAPGLDPATYTGGLRFFDAFEDDARMAMTVVRTAAAAGARAVSRVSVRGLRRRNGRVVGVQAMDTTTGAEVDIAARHVVSAAGPWTGEILAMLGEQQQPLTVRPSKGVHILVPRSRLALRTGLLTRTEKSVLFVIPWGPHWLIGDTDTDWRGETGRPVPHGGDVDYLLAKVNAFAATPLTRADVVGVFAGIRPLVQSGEVANTTKISREHTVSSPAQGLSVVAGGKYTTYRVMAADTVDVVLSDLGGGGRSVTAKRPLLGAAGYRRLAADAQRLAREYGLDRGVVDHLLGRYGDRIGDLLKAMEREPGLRQPISDDLPYVWAEVEYACTHEGAMSLTDILHRRTRIGIQLPDAGLAAAEAAADLAAGKLQWDAATRDAELAAYARAVAAQEEALKTTNDADASAVHRKLLEE